MTLRNPIRRIALAVALAIPSCTVNSSDTTSTCGPDPTVAGCTSGSMGYSCPAGAGTPSQSDSSLTCSMATAGNAGSTLYCCTTGAVGSSCAPDLTVASCPSGATGYSCTSTDTPSQSDTSLSCGSGTAGSAGATLFCCATTDAGADAAPDAGSCAPDSTVQSCPANSTGYSCTGPATPPQINPSIACGPGTPGNAGAMLYCCTTIDAGVDGGTCSVGAATGSASCDQCLDSQCCTALVSCDTPDSAGVDDAGLSACEQLLGCTLDCLAGNPDAGVDGGTLMTCQALCNPSYTVPEQQNASALLTCQATNCSTSCQ